MTNPGKTAIGESRITLNGKTVLAHRGQTILEAARNHGVHIPTLCYIQKLRPLGSCRMCVVEVEGTPTPVTACTTPVLDGMVVTTDSPRIERLRREVLKLILQKHPLNCHACEINGGCLLQDLVHAYDIGHNDLHAYTMRPIEFEPEPYATPLIKYHPQRCILCGRCVQACSEISEVGAIQFRGRGAATRIAPVIPTAEFKPECISCGECMSACPVNALTEAKGRPRGKAWETVRVKTVCAYCGCGCQLELNVSANRVTGVTPCDGGVNQGALCSKGRFGYDFVNHPDRLKRPMIRRNGRLEEVHWDQALDHCAERLAEILDTHGPQAVGGLSSARCTNEENYLFQKFMRSVIGTNNVDHCARLCHASTVAGLAEAFGSGAMTNSMAEVEDTDCILITGSNTSECHPIIGRMVKRAVDRKRAKLIVVDPRQVELVKFAHIWLRPRPGTDIAWINAMAHTILEEGLWDEEFVRNRTEGFEAFRDRVAEYTPERAEQITGIPADDLRRAARRYARGPRSMILYAMGITQHTSGTDNVKALANLAMLCGNIGVEGGGLNPLRGQNNVQGACDMGALPNVLPGYQPVTDEAVLARFQQRWNTGTRLSNRVGLTATEMFPAAVEGRLRAMIVMGENPALSDANASHVRKALESLDLLIVQDIFLTETAESADVVLPAASFAEKDGTFTNTERRVQRVRKAVEPPGRAMADWRILCELAQRLSRKIQARQAAAHAGGGDTFHPRPYAHGYWEYNSPSEIFDELAELTPPYAGMSYRRLDRGGLQWPCHTKYHPGTPILHQGRFVRGLGKFHAVEHTPPAEEPDESYPFLLSTGRIRYHYHTGTMTRRSQGLNFIAPEGFVELNPEDAAALKVRDGERVRLVSRRGGITSRVRITERSPRGLIFGTFHFSESPVNVLTNDALDPTAKIPEFKVSAVRVEKLPDESA